MAEFYSAEYTIYHGTPIGGKVFGGFIGKRCQKFTYTQVATGTAADTILLITLPPKSILLMSDTRITFAGWTSGATLSLGWKAYTDVDGATVALSAAGLLSVVSMTTDATWLNGTLVMGTSDDSVPVVWEKDFNNASEVVIYATIGTQAPGAADTLEGRFWYVQA